MILEELRDAYFVLLFPLMTCFLFSETAFCLKTKGKGIYYLTHTDGTNKETCFSFNFPNILTSYFSDGS